MGYIFDGPQRIVYLPAGETILDLKDLYSRWKQWVQAGDNAKFLEAFDSVGGNPIDPIAGTEIPAYIFIVNEWTIHPWEADHTLAVINGIIVRLGGGDPFEDTTGAFTVRINYQQPVQAITVSAGGGGGSSDLDEGAVAAAVWDALLTAHTNFGSMGEAMASAATGGDPAAVADAVWDEAMTGHVASGSFGLSSQQTQYQGSIWIDTVNGAAGTTIGTHGTPTNPVSNIADALTLATALGVRRYSFLGASVVVLASDYIGWEFVGVAAGTRIDLGTRDVSDTKFFHLKLIGVQGGIGKMICFQCRLAGPNNLRISASDCLITNDISFANGNSFFHNCSAGADLSFPPSLTFDNAATTFVAFRNYSGDLELEDMGANHEFSYDCPAGRLIINASCTGGTVVRRGAHNLVDNSGGAVTLSDELAAVDRVGIGIGAWDTLRSAHAISGTTGALMRSLVDNTGTFPLADIGDESILGQMTHKDAMLTFNQTTDSLEAISDRLSAAPGAVWDELLIGHDIPGSAARALKRHYCRFLPDQHAPPT